MNNSKCNKTEKRNSDKTKIIDIKGSTRIGSCTTKWVLYGQFTNKARLLENIMKRLQCHTRNSYSIDISEHCPTLRKKCNNGKRYYWEHHDASPPTELTRKKGVRVIKPCSCDIFIDRISEV